MTTLTVSCYLTKQTEWKLDRKVCRWPGSDTHSKLLTLISITDIITTTHLNSYVVLGRGVTPKYTECGLLIFLSDCSISTARFNFTCFYLRHWEMHARHIFHLHLSIREWMRLISLSGIPAHERLNYDFASTFELGLRLRKYVNEICLWDTNLVLRGDVENFSMHKHAPTVPRPSKKNISIFLYLPPH